MTLAAGALTAITLTATGVKTTLTLNWKSAAAGIGWQPTPAPYLFAQSRIAGSAPAMSRFLKATSLATALVARRQRDRLSRPTTRHAMAATSASDKFAAGVATATPLSMGNIVVGARLAVDTGAAAEIVEVTAITATSFNAACATAHDGSATPFAIVSAPPPDIGRGWLNLLPGSPYQDALGSAYPGRRRRRAAARDAEGDARFRAAEEGAVAERRAADETLKAPAPC